MIHHADLPGLPIDDLYVYLDILSDAIKHWGESPVHDLTVVFPAECREIISKILTPR